MPRLIVVHDGVHALDPQGVDGPIEHDPLIDRSQDNRIRSRKETVKFRARGRVGLTYKEVEKACTLG